MACMEDEPTNPSEKFPLTGFARDGDHRQCGGRETLGLQMLAAMDSESDSKYCFRHKPGRSHVIRCTSASVTSLSIKSIVDVWDAARIGFDRDARDR
jgi:hypothetical protein